MLYSVGVLRVNDIKTLRGASSCLTAARTYGKRTRNLCNIDAIGHHGYMLPDKSARRQMLWKECRWTLVNVAGWWRTAMEAGEAC